MVEKPLYIGSAIDIGSSSSCGTQHENSHLLSPQPITCLPPCIQHENDNLHGRTILLCTHSLGTPRTE